MNVAITGGGIVDFKGPLNTGATITFGVGGSAGAGTLELDQSFGMGTTTVPATVVNFGTDDVIDLTKINIDDGLSLSFQENGTNTGGTLTVSQPVNSGSIVVNFTLADDTVYNPFDFTALNDPWGGTEVVYGTVDYWTGGAESDSWTGSNWSGDTPASTDTVVIQPATGTTITLDDAETIANLLMIGDDATLHIDGDGALTVTNALQVSGTLEVDDTGSQFQVDGPVRVDGGSEIDATGSGAAVKFSDDQVGNAGTIAAEEHGRVVFDGSDVWNEGSGGIEATDRGEVVFADGTVDNARHAKIEAEGRGSKVKFFREDVDNLGSIAATWGAAVLFADSQVDNAWSGTITADGRGSQVKFDQSTVDNSGRIAAENRGAVLFDGAQLDNGRHGMIEADGRGSEVKFDDSGVDNSGRIEAEYRGAVLFDHSQLDNARDGTIEADGRKSEVKFDRDLVDNSGRIEADHGGKVSFYESQVDNARGGTIEADGGGSVVAFDRDQIDNAGRIEAKHGGTVLFGESHIDNARHGTIEADGHGTRLEFNRDHVDNWGRVEADNDASVAFDQSHVDNDGTIEARHGGTVTFADGTTLTNEVGGTINADDGTITFDTGHTIGNAGLLEATDGGTLDVQDSTIDNTGTGSGHGILIDGTSTFLVDSASLTLDGGGNISLMSGSTFTEVPDYETMGSGTVILVDNVDNQDNTISGAGTIGSGDGGLALTNHGTIDANISGETLTLDTGNTIDNYGTLEATSGGILQIDDPVINEPDPGSIEVNGGTVDFVNASSAGMTFTGAGTLELGSAQNYTGAISGFGSGDIVDATDFPLNAPIGTPTQPAYYTVDSWNANTSTLTLNTIDGSGNNYDTANLNFTGGTYSQTSFALTADANGGTEVIADPATVTFTSGIDGTTGNAVEGEAVTVNVTDADNGADLGTISYTWFDNGLLVGSDTGDSYTPSNSDIGNTLDVLVSFTDPTTDNPDQVTLVAGTVEAPPPPPGPTEPFTWNGGIGDWEDFNWNNAGLYPQSGDNVDIDFAGTYTVTVDHADAATSLSITNTSVTLDITDGGSLAVSGTVQNAGTIVVAGVSAETTLATASSVSFGGLVTNTGSIKVGGAYVASVPISPSSSSAIVIAPSVTFGGTVINTAHTIAVTSSNAFVNLAGATVEGGTIVNSGTILVSSDSTIDDNATVSGGAITIDDSTLTFGNGATSDIDTLIGVAITVTNGGAISVAGTETTLTFASGNSSISNGGGPVGVIDNSGSIEVASGATLLSMGWRSITSPAAI